MRRERKPITPILAGLAVGMAVEASETGTPAKDGRASLADGARARTGRCRRHAPAAGRALAVACSLLWLASCDDGHELGTMSMDNQPRYDAQEKSDFFKDGQASRPRVQGTVTFGQAATERPAVNLALLERGQERYQIFCVMCHGSAGYGNGIVAQHGFPMPPSFHTQRARGYDDARLYTIITNGLGKMPPYATQIPPQDRWAIVSYLRALQRSQNGSIDDVPAEARAAVSPGLVEQGTTIGPLSREAMPDQQRPSPTSPAAGPLRGDWAPDAAQAKHGLTTMKPAGMRPAGDTGSNDTGSNDTGLIDAGSNDAGLIDAGSVGAGSREAVSSQAASEAGKGNRRGTGDAGARRDDSVDSEGKAGRAKGPASDASAPPTSHPSTGPGGGI